MQDGLFGHDGLEQLDHFSDQRVEANEPGDELALARISQHLARQVGGAMGGLFDLAQHRQGRRLWSKGDVGQAGVAEHGG